MNPNWAEENLKTIRTLMERSAVYRRALAPVMIVVGVLGLLAAIAGKALGYGLFSEFVILWNGVAIMAIAVAFLITRRQAIKDQEPFLSAPTRRVIQAMAPPLFSGFMVSVFSVGEIGERQQGSAWLVPVCLWLFFYGCALHAAGFFTPRGIRLLGWIFISGPLILIGMAFFNAHVLNMRFPDYYDIMGIFFGGLHLAYGIYLYFTEKKTPVA